jgi:hypothetical protein
MGHLPKLQPSALRHLERIPPNILRTFHDSTGETGIHLVLRQLPTPSARVHEITNALSFSSGNLTAVVAKGIFRQPDITGICIFAKVRRTRGQQQYEMFV